MSNKTLGLSDELHEYLKGDEVAPRFIAGAYRKLRKHDAAMWTLTQHFADIARSEVGHAITGNAAINIFLWHKSGHQLVEEYFEFTSGMREAFRRLEKRPGHYSDLLLSYGKHVAVLRHRPHPLAYWLLTTDPEDKPVRERALEQNARIPAFEALRKLAARYPHGVVGGQRAAAA